MKLLFVSILLFFFSFESNAAVTINHVDVIGNSKTKKKSIMKWGQIELGKELTEDEFDWVKEKLRQAYQFNLLDIKLIDDKLEIKIEEKWSLFPVPMLTQSGNYFSRGLLVYENNFLGRLGTFAPGLFFTNSGINGVIYWQEDNIFAQNYGMKVILLHKNDLTQFSRKGQLQKSVENRLNTVILTPNYHEGRNDYKLGPIYMEKTVVDNISGQELFHSERFGLYYRHHYNSFRKLPVLFDGYQTTIDFFNFYDGKEYDMLLSGDIQYVKPIGKHFFKSEVHFHYSDNSGFISPKNLGGNEGYRGYDRESFPVKGNAGFMLQQQFHLWSSFYTSGFYEYNFSRVISPLYDRGDLSESTIGANFSYYFRNISIPAVIFEFARNIDDQSNHVIVNVGLSL